MGRDGRIVDTVEETLALGRSIGKGASEKTVFCFFGAVGAGKTTLIKGIYEGWMGLAAASVLSPTFVYLNVYEGTQGRRGYHFDLYRLSSSEAFWALGLDEYLFMPQSLACIEWSERMGPLLPEGHLAIHIEALTPSKRKIVIDEAFVF